MSRKKGNSGKYVPTKTLTIDDVKKLVRESGIPVSIIEKGIGMPLTTLDKVINDRLINGKPRSLPAKYEAPLIQFIKEKKAAKADLLIETKEVFEDLNIPVTEEDIDIPDKQRKLDWINKLQEVKDEIESD